MAIDIEAFYQRYSPMVYRRCKAMLRNEDEAMDAMQDVFVKLLRNGKNLHDRFPSSLLYTIATNTCLNRIRWKARHSQTGHDDVEEFVFISTDKGLDQVEAKLMLEKILETESERTRAICFMYHVDDMTLKEIGETVGMSISGVRKRLIAFQNRARISFDGGMKHA
ncbi:sigma-70 family RNA polymerase sigma factor [Treponema sp. OttesenSCG-928-L16]|nr:sigma-70 family RNA polymerase sigma factor [Treponema sp. OttesenSCG-928-L16]